MNFELEKTMKIIKGCENCSFKDNCPVTIKESTYCPKKVEQLMYPGEAGEDRLLFMTERIINGLSWLPHN